MTLKFLGAGAALAFGCIAMTVASAQADVIYTYTGNHFTTVLNNNPAPAPQYTTTDSVSGNFTLPTALGDDLPLTTIDPTSFSFTDGVQTLTNSTPGIVTSFNIATNAAGLPSLWSIDITTILLGTTEDIFTDLSTNAHFTADGGSQVNSSNLANQGRNINPGTWTVSSTSVAEPDSAWLLAAGLAFLFWRERSAAMALVRRRQRLIEPAAS